MAYHLNATITKHSEDRDDMSTLVIIPAYNEEDSIISTVEELKAIAPDYDYVIVNDGSKDKTADICRQRNYCLIDLPCNLGLTGAFQTGMKYAYRHGYDHAIQFDADGQHMPQYICELEQAMDDADAGIVIGSRFVIEQKPKTLRMLGSNLISLLIRITTGTTIKDPTSGMRMYNKAEIAQFALRNDLSPEPDTIAFLIKRKNTKVVEHQVVMRERTAGESYLTLSKSISYMVNSCTAILFSLWFRR